MPDNRQATSLIGGLALSIIAVTAELRAFQEVEKIRTFEASLDFTVLTVIFAALFVCGIILMLRSYFASRNNSA